MTKGLPKRDDIGCRYCKSIFTPKHEAHVFCNAACGERHRQPGENQRKRLDYSSPGGRERARRWARKQELKRVGWTMEEHDAVFYAQGGLCAICGQSNYERGMNLSLAADHSHETGKRRSLLCKRCNQGIGLFEDSPDTLQNAATYLDTWGRA